MFRKVPKKRFILEFGEWSVSLNLYHVVDSCRWPLLYSILGMFMWSDRHDFERMCREDHREHSVPMVELSMGLGDGEC
jgi:hypothetical protein